MEEQKQRREGGRKEKKKKKEEGVNRQLPLWNCKFCQLPYEINKTSITSMKLHNVNQFNLSVKFFCSQHDVLQIPPEVLQLCAKCPLNLKIHFFSYPKIHIFFFLSKTCKFGLSYWPMKIDILSNNLSDYRMVKAEQKRIKRILCKALKM